MPPRPSVKAILICDDIIHEALTHKKSLIGIFENIHVARFPAHYPRIAVYLNLTDAHGKYRLELNLIGSSDGSVLGRGATPEVEIGSPLDTCEFALKINNVAFPGPGTYEFQVFANGEMLATKVFRVKQVQRPPEMPFQGPGAGGA